MSDSKHTPGLWEIEPEMSAAKKRQVSAFSADGNRVLQIVIRSFRPDEDARLIAAAPVLLKMLKNIVAAVPRVLRDEGLLNDAEAVIAKAEGRA